MSAERYTTLWPVLIPIAIGTLLIGALVIVNGTRSSAIAYACGFARGQSATIYQIDPSKTAESETPICAKFREVALARGFTPANWTVNHGR